MIIDALKIVAGLNAFGGLVGLLALMPASGGYSSPPIALFVPGAALFASGLVGLVMLWAVAEALEHLQAIRQQLAPVAQAVDVYTPAGLNLS